MPSRRTWLRLSVALTLLVTLIAILYLGGRYLLQRNGVERLDWQGISLSAAGVQVDGLQLTRHSSAGTLELHGQGLQLAWRDLGFSLPFFQHLAVDRLTISWLPASQQSEPATPARDLDPQRLAAPLALLPRSLTISALDATLPCARGQCTASGRLNLQRDEAEQTRLQLDLDHQAQQISLSLAAHPHDDTLGLQLTLAVDQQAQLTIDSSLARNADGLAWSGQLDATRLPQAAALQSWLSAWAVPAGTPWPEAPGEAALQGSWQLHLPGRAPSVDNLLAATGRFDLQGNLPQPWPFPGLGQLQGRLALAAHNEGQHWIARRIEADLRLTQPTGDWLDAVPAPLRSESVQLQVQADAPLGDLRAELAERSLPLKLTLAVRGATQLDLQGRLAVASSAPWAVQFADTRLTTRTARAEGAGWQLGDLRSALTLAGHADGAALALTFGQGSQVQAATVQGAALGAQRLQLGLAGSALDLQVQAGAVQRWQFKGPLQLNAARVEQANLKPQGWRLQAELDAADGAGSLRGTLSNDSDLQLGLLTRLDAARNLSLEATLGELFLRSGNPLANTLAQWPALLDLDSGRVNATATLALAAGSDAPSLDLNLSGAGLGGIYDRAELSGMDIRLQLQLARERFELYVAQLKIEQANPGLPIGPLEARARYSAALASTDQGTLEVNLAQTAFMGGHVTLTPARWDLAAGNQLFPIRIRGLELQQLFTLYPAEGLAGDGTLDGDLPLRLGPNGIEVDGGHIAAREPGGRLQFSSERIRALGRSNPAMQLVTQSLEDFRFTTLNSAVDYDQHGKLRLAMRLEGQNPAIENGRPIHFNINLEEDIPNLLASLQLTDRVNDIITRRVQQRMLERNTAPKEP